MKALVSVVAGLVLTISTSFLKVSSSCGDIFGCDESFGFPLVTFFTNGDAGGVFNFFGILGNLIVYSTVTFMLLRYLEKKNFLTNKLMSVIYGLLLLVIFVGLVFFFNQ
jgi:hypothetical protein